MAIQTITYTNKVDLNIDNTIPAINKVVADDMNEIKGVVNNNANELDGLVIPEIQNAQSDSTTDAYSCDYVNKALDNKKVLYEDSTGTSGNIVLSDSASNYSYLMVYWRSVWNSSRNGVAIAPTSTNNWCLEETVVESGSGSSRYTNIAVYYIGGTSFNLNKASNYNSQNSNTFIITKIVGYK